MPNSMTGYGRWESPDQDMPWTFTWEIKSVNSRHLDLKWRLPNFLRCMETDWEKIVRGAALRGRVELYLHVKILDSDAMAMSFDASSAKAMLRELERLARDLGVEYQPDLNRFLTMSQLWGDDSCAPDPALAKELSVGLENALADWNESRATEGDAMAKDMAKRVIRLEQWLERIRDRVPQVREQKIEALNTRIATLLEKHAIDPDPDRLLQEIAVLSDKLDVSEEMTRLAAHLDRLSTIMDQDGDTGKRLDFTLQECFREINTCGNKAQDAQISRLVVDFKTELEKCREQAQNIE